MNYKRYKNMPDTRPVDDWGIPIGKPYEQKEWEQLTPDEMMADFEWKSDILSVFGEEVTGATFYQDYLFRELYEGELDGEYKILLTEYDADKGKKIHKIDVDEIADYLKLSDVALSPCLFYRNWRKKKLLNYVSAFVLDIDKLRPMQLQRFFKLFEENRLLTPTFIANSGSGVHFYYLLDKMLKIDSIENEANNLIAEEIYKKLYDDVKIKEKWKDAQKHWMGQDYRVVNSKTKLHQTSQIFRVGEIYTVEQLIEHYGIKIDRKKKYASKPMVKYASNIAKDLGIEPPDFSDSAKTYDFIKEHKDEAYEVREKRRQEKKEKEAKKKKSKKSGTRKPVTWYKNTLYYMQDHTEEGYRFSSMKALASIAHIENIPKDVFIQDIEELSAYWTAFNWKGDDFNQKNVEAIIRYYDNASKYQPSSEKLEEWLGYEFKRIGKKENGRSSKEHLRADYWINENGRPTVNVCKQNRELALQYMRENGEIAGRPTEEQTVREWQEANPKGKKADCIRETGLSKPTVYRWWK